MFCADYISSFIFHGLVTGGLLEASHRGLLGPSLTPTKVSESLKYSGVPVLLGGLAGFIGAASVFPFDFVRRGVMPGKVLFRHSLSTVPYAGVFFGLYFSNRDGKRTGSQFGWALTSALAACIAEVPFDSAKHAMMGSRRTMLMVNGLYVPFGALMLVMYDKAMENVALKQFSVKVF